MKERAYFEEKYHVSKYQEKPICVVVPTFNNVPESRYQYNINSILQQ